MAATPIALLLCNTLELAANTLYQVSHPSGHCNISNIGEAGNAGNIYYRYDGKPAAVNSPQCATLLPGATDLAIAFHSPISIIADNDTTVVIRCY